MITTFFFAIPFIGNLYEERDVIYPEKVKCSEWPEIRCWGHDHHTLAIFIYIIFNQPTINPMTESATLTNRSGGWQAVLLAGLVAGVLDGTAAVISTYISIGRGFEAVFRFVASGVFGPAAFEGGPSMIVAGVCFHMLIAMIWAIVFFFIYPLLKGLGRNKILVGLLYGVVVWLCMNLIVVPLSNTPKFPFNPIGMIKGMAILMVCIGLPISIIIGKYYSRRDQ